MPGDKSAEAANGGGERGKDEKKGGEKITDINRLKYVKSAFAQYLSETPEINNPGNESIKKCIEDVNQCLDGIIEDSQAAKGWNEVVVEQLKRICGQRGNTVIGCLVGLTECFNDYPGNYSDAIAICRFINLALVSVKFPSLRAYGTPRPSPRTPAATTPITTPGFTPIRDRRDPEQFSSPVKAISFPPLSPTQEEESVPHKPENKTPQCLSIRWVHAILICDDFTSEKARNNLANLDTIIEQTVSMLQQELDASADEVNWNEFIKKHPDNCILNQFINFVCLYEYREKPEIVVPYVIKMLIGINTDVVSHTHSASSSSDSTTSSTTVSPMAAPVTHISSPAEKSQSNSPKLSKWSLGISGVGLLCMIAWPIIVATGGAAAVALALGYGGFLLFSVGISALVCNSQPDGKDREVRRLLKSDEKKPLVDHTIVLTSGTYVDLANGSLGGARQREQSDTTPASSCSNASYSYNCRPSQHSLASANVPTPRTSDAEDDNEDDGVETRCCGFFGR